MPSTQRFKSDLKDYTVIVKHQTDKAALIFDGSVECWVPLSQVELTPNKDDRTYTCTMPAWLAVEKGLDVEDAPDR